MKAGKPVWRNVWITAQISIEGKINREVKDGIWNKIGVHMRRNVWEVTVEILMANLEALY